jgi:hypothetical protein
MSATKEQVDHAIKQEPLGKARFFSILICFVRSSRLRGQAEDSDPALLPAVVRLGTVQ